MKVKTAQIRFQGSDKIEVMMRRILQFFNYGVSGP
jgi:hypothetical protein